MRLKLEVDEGIAVSLSEDDGTGHEGPYRCYNPARQTHHGCFDIAIAQRPVHENDPFHDKGNADGQKNVEMRWLIDDADPRKQPLKILQQKVPVFEKPEHAQVHADAANQPGPARMRAFRLGNLSAEPKIHCRRGKEQRGERRVSRAVKDVARAYEKIFPRVPGTNAPVGSDDDCKKGDERKRIEKHGWRAIAYLRGTLMASTFCQIISRIESVRVEN